MLNVHMYGPWNSPDPTPVVLAVHGVTGHGARWRGLADSEVPGARVLAPDLRGHARSTWDPPWHFEQLVDDLVEVVEHYARGSATVVGHSLGGALACRLARSRPDLVSALLLLDPAQGLDPRMCLTIAEQTVAHFDFSSVEEARQEKKSGAWAEVPDDVLDTEIAEHLAHRDTGRWEWDVSCAAVTAMWGELARPVVTPPAGIPTTVLRASRALFVTEAFALSLPDSAELVTVDSDHMVAQEVPGVVGEHLRRVLPDHAE
ncbi:alpha/beta hydrolase [Tsukamurella sp. 8F]|uniref:alpha/beta fold hydrolase n=1 Tax=unclassified Tsukamurella TaxID=2633480 RepID=UPI0023BA0703|nr:MULTISPECIES: alpha/beta hydrolase [unclassified Tsukamurella]MDF0528900.1 alpha/beta hydrolase [Tsukamurella sp. 8J]MDF0586735.1 alpha/beta hydrolase [Tsukamurella sp. 8F]